MSEPLFQISDIDAVFVRAIAWGDFTKVKVRDNALKSWWHKNVRTMHGRARLQDWMHKVNEYCIDHDTETKVALAHDQTNCKTNERRLRIYCKGEKGETYKDVIISNDSSAMITVEE
jgi:hypothetical protein